ncbi:hypothetical protein K435DRAFT_807665 [Dendrothele bispora CBS 962.96]|uniref:DUF7025 domain-containing protein n=1 Tax=Dendrothele bispora (strain CBS 962.96) TaxID=1314807 RepID=A0A4S8L4C8_DENBC|nr:hypothetical protein K435DRAFT_807665 [Dendrothele bispora CBS 962.96]
MTSPEKSSSDTSNDKLARSGPQLMIEATQTVIPSSTDGASDSTNEAVVTGSESTSDSTKTEGSSFDNITPNKDESKEERTQEVHNHYILRFQKKDLRSGWASYDPNTVGKNTDKEEEPEGSENYFYLNKRWYMPNATPILVLSDFSKPLLNFVRSTVGGKSFTRKPELDIGDFFLQLKSIRKKLEQIHLAIEVNSSFTFEDKLKLANEMGKGDSNIDNLELALSHGHITFDLYAALKVLIHVYILTSILDPSLQYLFEPGEYAATNDHEFSLPIAFKITERYYYTSFGKEYFTVEGEGLKWDGEAYSEYSITRECETFEGTKEIRKLPFNHVSQELEEILNKWLMNFECKARGKLYTTFPGVHYQVYGRSGGLPINDDDTVTRNTHDTSDNPRSPSEESPTGLSRNYGNINKYTEQDNRNIGRNIENHGIYYEFEERRIVYVNNGDWKTVVATGGMAFWACHTTTQLGESYTQQNQLQLPTNKAITTIYAQHSFDHLPSLALSHGLGGSVDEDMGELLKTIGQLQDRTSIGTVHETYICILYASQVYAFDNSEEYGILAGPLVKIDEH